MERSEHDLLIQIDERMRGLISRFDQHLEWAEVQIVQNDKAHEGFANRLGSIERWQYKVLGGVSLLMVLLTLLSHLWKP